MGNNNSVNQFNNENVKNFKNNYTFVRQENSADFGKIQVFKNNKVEEDLVFTFARAFNNEQQLDDYVQIISQQQMANEVRIIGYQKVIKSTTCGNSFVVNVFAEYLAYDLGKEFVKRQAKKDLFSEAELKYVLKSTQPLLQSNTYLDARPQQLYLTEQGFIRYMSNFNQSAYQSAIARGQKTYLSPELMQALQKKDMSPQVNVRQSNTFSLGVTLLQLSTLQNVENKVYDWKLKQVNEKAIESLLQEVQQKYSISYTQQLRQMLSQVPEKRVILATQQSGIPARRTLVQTRVINQVPTIQQSQVIKQDLQQSQIKEESVQLKQSQVSQKLSQKLSQKMSNNVIDIDQLQRQQSQYVQ